MFLLSIICSDCKNTAFVTWKLNSFWLIREGSNMQKTVFLQSLRIIFEKKIHFWGITTFAFPALITSKQTIGGNMPDGNDARSEPEPIMGPVPIVFIFWLIDWLSLYHPKWLLTPLWNFPDTSLPQFQQKIGETKVLKHLAINSDNA